MTSHTCTKGSHPPWGNITVCMAYQESSFGPGNQNPKGSGLYEGSLNLTCGAFCDLLGAGCDWVKAYTGNSSGSSIQPGSSKKCKCLAQYQAFLRNASPCDKILAWYNYATLRGWQNVGPGPGQPGDYRPGSPTGTLIQNCANCIDQTPVQCRHYFDAPIPPFNDICNYCAGKIHP